LVGCDIDSDEEPLSATKEIPLVRVGLDSIKNVP
jgi:hypothetical protein